MKANTSRLYEDVRFLTELRPFRNYQNLASLAQVVDYIKNEFEQAGLEVQCQKWNAAGNEYTNVIGVYNGHKSKRLIVGAHYDVCGEQPGADDNASAVAGLLESARLIGEDKPELDYAIKSKYEAWKDNGWKDGNGKEIKNWKTTLRNTMPYLKPIEQPKEETDREYKIRMLRERGFAV